MKNIFKYYLKFTSEKLSFYSKLNEIKYKKFIFSDKPNKIYIVNDIYDYFGFKLIILIPIKKRKFFSRLEYIEITDKQFFEKYSKNEIKEII